MSDNPIKSLDDVKIRMLNMNEFSRKDLVEIFEKYESFVPNPLNALIQIAENNEGKIVALAVLQPQYHAEPIYVDPEYSHTMLHKRIIETLLKPFEGIKGLRIWVFSPNNKIANLAMRFGFKLKNYEVFVKEL